MYTSLGVHDKPLYMGNVENYPAATGIPVSAERKGSQLYFVRKVGPVVMKGVPRVQVKHA